MARNHGFSSSRVKSVTRLFLSRSQSFKNHIEPPRNRLTGFMAEDHRNRNTIETNLKERWERCVSLTNGLAFNGQLRLTDR